MVLEWGGQLWYLFLNCHQSKSRNAGMRDLQVQMAASELCPIPLAFLEICLKIFKETGRKISTAMETWLINQQCLRTLGRILISHMEMGPM